MVEIRDGLGRNFECKKCNKYLTLSSKDNYKGCSNCGFENDLSPNFHWYDNLYLWIFVLAAILLNYHFLFQ